MRYMAQRSFGTYSTIISSFFLEYTQIFYCQTNPTLPHSTPHRQGFRTQCLTRFISGEEYYISNTNGGPRMYINMEDYISRSNGDVVNTQFQKVISLFREKCSARLHWGKAGFPRHAPCFDGAVEYGESWCHFGCAANQLDPENKFQSEWDGWRFKATRGDEGEVSFSSCCTAEGFDGAACQCVSGTSCFVSVSEAGE